MKAWYSRNGSPDARAGDSAERSNGHALLDRQGLEILGQLPQHLVEPHGLRHRLDLAHFQSREIEHAPDETDHALDLLQVAFENALVFVGGSGALERELELAAEHGEGRAELVGCVVREAELFVEGRLDAVHHGVEGQGELGELAAFARRLDSLVQAPLGYAPQGFGHGAQGRDEPPSDEGSGAGADRGGGWREEHEENSKRGESPEHPALGHDDLDDGRKPYVQLEGNR